MSPTAIRWSLLLAASVALLVAAAGGESLGSRFASPDTDRVGAAPSTAEEASPSTIAVQDEYYVFAAPEEQGTVDPITGVFALKLVDLSVPTATVALELTRAYVASDVSGGLLGSRWWLNWEPRLIRDQAGIRIAEMGVVMEFSPTGEDATVLSSLTGERLLLRDDSARRIRVDGTQDVFSANGQLTQRCMGGTTFSLKYDEQGRLARIDGPGSAYLAFQYGATGAITVQTATGDAVTYELRAQRLARVTRKSGVVTEYSYADQGQLQRIQHPQFGSIEFTYDAQGALAARRWPDGSVERIERPAPDTVRYVGVDGSATLTRFDRAQRVATIVESSGQKTLLRLDRGGRITEVIGGDGKTTRFAHDDQGRLSGITGDQGAPLLFQYPGDEREPCGAVDSGGEGYQIERDGQGRIVELQQGAAGSTAFQYDGQGRPTRVESSHAPPLSFAYDETGQVNCLTNAAGRSMRLERNEQGSIVRMVGFGGGETCWNYDSQRRVTSEIDAAGATVQYEYAPSGLLRSRTDATGAVTQYRFHGRSVTVRDPLGRDWTTEYDPAGRIARAVTPSGGEERFEHDSVGNLVGYVDAGGRRVRYDYDARGAIAAITAADGSRTSCRYDHAGNLCEVADALGRRTRYEYDSTGVLQKTIAANGTETFWEQGPRGLRADRSPMPTEHRLSSPTIGTVIWWRCCAATASCNAAVTTRWIDLWRKRTTTA